jgi:uncharacterized protein YlxP (DUF503 family)
MVVGVLRLELRIPGAHSLKEKRRVVRAIASRVRNKFNVSIAECEEQDTWQRAVLGVAQVGNDRPHVDACLRNVVHFIDAQHLAPIGAETVEFLHY